MGVASDITRRQTPHLLALTIFLCLVHSALWALGVAGVSLTRARTWRRRYKVCLAVERVGRSTEGLHGNFQNYFGNFLFSFWLKNNKCVYLWNTTCIFLLHLADVVNKPITLTVYLTVVRMSESVPAIFKLYDYMLHPHTRKYVTSSLYPHPCFPLLSIVYDNLLPTFCSFKKRLYISKIRRQYSFHGLFP